MELTSHVKVGLLAFCTVAVNCTVAPVATCVVGADTLTVGEGGTGAAVGAGSPPEVAAQEISASGAMNIPTRQRTPTQEPHAVSRKREMGVPL